MSFTNKHLSFSRIQRFEQCPLSFKLHYIDKLSSEPGVELRFGKAIHWVLEQLVGEHALETSVGALSLDYALELWQHAWVEGIGPFQDGIEILKAFVAREGAVDPRDVLAVERSFESAIGRFRVIGSIDRVDRVNDTTIRVRDYKTNRLIFTRDEVDESLQLSLYHIAAQQLWPWATTIELQFDMVRHDIRLRTSRTPEQLDAARRYILAIGERTESATAFPARPNANCGYCDHRGQCDAYAAALAGKRYFVAEDVADLEMVAREREEVARIAKVAYARKQELDDVLKARLEHAEKLELGGVRYQVVNTSSVDYPLEPTLRLLGEATGVARDELVAKVATIDKGALQGLMKALPKVVKAEIEARANRTITPRFVAKEVRS